MKTILMVVFMSWALPAWAANFSNLNKDGFILDGNDPISYFDSEHPKKGNPKFQAQYDEATYLFINEENKQKFLKDPKKYEPQFGGWCAYAVADSKSKVDVDPDSFLIQDGRLLLFYKGLWGNTREKWTHTKEKDSKAFLLEADSNWPKVKTIAP